ncbi:[protein-PII] uridylyltransferase [Frateuria aurantia]
MSTTVLPSLSPLLPARLPLPVPRSGVAGEARRALQQWLADLDRGLARAFDEGGDAGVLAARRAAAIDNLLEHVWVASLGEPRDAALFACGGYGRGLLFPHSDVDLLVLVDQGDAGRARALEQFLATLWDIGLKIGSAVRNATQCRELAAADLSVFTSLMDARLIAGDASLQREVEVILEAPELWPPRAYLEARIAERDARHARFDDTTYQLEPNLKDGPGGLRTLDALRWLARRLLGESGFDGLVRRGWLDPAERDTLLQAQATLWRIRFALHLEAGRPEERLLFDYQRALARRLGFEDEHSSNLGVEQFMQSYFRAATQVERLGVQLTERFDELFDDPDDCHRLNADFASRAGRLTLVDPELFIRRPQALIEIFVVRLEHTEVVGLAAETMRRIHQAIAHHGEALADSPEVLAALIDLLRRGPVAVDALWRMNRFGLLTAMLPPLARVFGRMQYDLFHVYTVDEHTMRVLRNVARFAEPSSAQAFPLAHQLMSGLPKPELLLLAALFHDIAKGRGGDHSVLGEMDAREFCRRAELDADDTELVAWLVRWHLLMSETAQRRDITDPLVVQRFANEVADWERLDHLYLLTVADIIGTSAKLWNSWKDRLLRDLYTSAHYVLRSDSEATPHASVRAQSTRDQAMARLISEGLDPAAIETVWDDFPQASFLRHKLAQICQQTRAILRADGAVPVVDVQPVSVRGCTDLFVYAEDRPGLFATITATLDRLRFSVMQARILNSRHQRALDTFLLLDADTQAPASAERAVELQHAIEKALRHPAAAKPARRGLSRHQKYFQSPPRIAFSTVGRLTQLALVSSDRPGLLAAVAQAFEEAGVNVHDARIATFGERVEDFFMVSGGDQAALDLTTQESLLHAILARLGNRR